MEKARLDNICCRSLKGKWHMDFSWSRNLHRGGIKMNHSFQGGLRKKE